MNNLSKKTTSAESLAEAGSSYKVPENANRPYKIQKIEKDIKLRVEFKKDITQEQKLETLIAVDKSIMDYLVTLHPMEVYKISISTKTARIKDNDFATVTANSTLGYAATQAVPPPPVGGPHKEIFAGIPRSLQNNIKALISIK